MDTKLRFSNTSLDRLPPVTSRTTFRDALIPNLYLRVSARTQGKTFYLKKYVNRKNKWHRLGAYPDMSVADARLEAQRLLTDIAHGHTLEVDDPRTITLEQCFDDYLIKHTLRGRTKADYIEVIDRYIPDWKPLPLHKITRKMVSDRHAEIGLRTKAKADATFRVLRALFNHAHAHFRDNQDRPLYTSNPVQVLTETKQWFNLKRRRNFIKKANLAAWHKKLVDSGEVELKDYLSVLLMTGMRSESVGDLRSREGCINQFGDPCPVWYSKRKVIGWMNKNNEWTEIPVSDHVAEILDRRPVIDGQLFHGMTDWEFRKKRTALRLEHTRHDLRRTYLTFCESLGIPMLTAKRLAGHRTQDRDVTAGYIIPDEDELRIVANRISECFQEALNGTL